MRLVIIESPYAGDVKLNLRYLRAALYDCLRRGEAPYASHALYTQVLDDSILEERTLGIEAGLAWGKKADVTVAYIDLGISNGMRVGIARAQAEGRPVEERSLPAWASKECGTRCSVCGEPQFQTPSGTVCKNGHGGADPLP
jgi:hypothetical protein